MKKGFPNTNYISNQLWNRQNPSKESPITLKDYHSSIKSKGKKSCYENIRLLIENVMWEFLFSILYRFFHFTFKCYSIILETVKKHKIFGFLHFSCLLFCSKVIKEWILSKNFGVMPALSDSFRLIQC